MKRYLNTPEEVIDALQDGKKVETESLEYKFINGILVAISKTDKNWIVYPALSSSVIPYINEPDPVKPEVGKFYKTMDGSKAFIFAKLGGKYPYPFYVVKVGELGAYIVNTDGKQPCDDKRPLDLVAPWED